MQPRQESVDKILNVEYLVNMTHDFATTLREKRRAAGLSQRRLAELAEVDFSYISKLENGRLPAPAAETISRMAKILNCPAEELLSAAKKMPGGLEDNLSAQPEALRFLQEASELNLSPEEWERMTGKLRELRSSETPKRRKP
jgi:transcriptional regulator with XRE-family HTH domain